MNEQVLKGHWKQAKGQIKEIWGKITDDEIDQIDGNYDQLVGKLQTKYGYQLEESRNKVNDMLKKLDSKTKH